MSGEATKSPAQTAAKPRPARFRWLWLVVGVVLALVAGVALGEAAGWPFLASPMQRWLSSTLKREVSLAADSATQPRVKVGLLGGLRLDAGRIRLVAPAWSSEPHMLLASDASLRLAYSDLWRAYRGGGLHITSIKAQQLDLAIERLADGRASWQFGPDPAPSQATVLSIGTLEVNDGALRYRDAIVDAAVDAHFTLVDGTGAPTPIAAASAAASVAPTNHTASDTPRGLRVVASGRYRGFALKAHVQTSGILPWMSSEAATVAVPLTLQASIGRAKLDFRGTATDVMHLHAMQGAFTLAGPSLAAVGDPVGVTLPSTPPFRAKGLVAKNDTVWNAVVESAHIGTSRLNGEFTYDAGRAKPLLSGRLGGAKLVLADLAPAIGAAAPAPPSNGAAARAGRSDGKVLPQRDFDLPSLRAMDANVVVDIAEVDLGTSYLEALKPLRGHLRLADGVLRLSDLDTRAAQGRLAGSLELDGRGERALWTAALRWNDLRLEQWLRQPRADGGPPYVAGRLRGVANVSGEGRSTAKILASLQGQVSMQLQEGMVSHLAIEAAGIDIAESLGVMIRGDKALKVNCGVADLQAKDGVLRPRVLVLDTDDSSVWVDGSISLATETLDVRAVVSPKDFSPLALRTPLHVTGALADPQLSLEKGPLARRLGAAALMALIAPAAALLPLVDPGDADEAGRALAQGCRALAERSGIRSAAARPRPTKP